MEQASSAVIKNLALSLESLRKARGLTQASLAALSGVPRATIAHVESGEGNPSLAIVAKLATALGVMVEELLQPPKPSCVLVKSGELKCLNDPQQAVVKVDLLPKTVPGLQLERLAFKPHGVLPGAPHAKGTREYFMCTRGHIMIRVEGEEYLLEDGDVLAFPGDRRHFYKNMSADKSEGISLVALNYGD